MTNLTAIRGDSQEYELSITDEFGDPYDLTGADVWFTVSRLVSKRLGDGIVVDAPTTGVAVVTINAGETAAAPGHRATYPFDVQIKLADGAVRTPIRGRFIVLPDVTTDI